MKLVRPYCQAYILIELNDTMVKKLYSERLES